MRTRVDYYQRNLFNIFPPFDQRTVRHCGICVEWINKQDNVWPLPHHHQAVSSPSALFSVAGSFFCVYAWTRDLGVFVQLKGIFMKAGHAVFLCEKDLLCLQFHSVVIIILLSHQLNN